jgi:hypothetical protein
VRADAEPYDILDDVSRGSEAEAMSFGFTIRAARA